MNTNIRIGSIDLKNPVIAASGTYGYAREYGEAIDINALGAIVVKGISLEPSKGNPEPRIAETPCGMLNSIGLENVGIKAFINSTVSRIPEIDSLLIKNRI